MRNTFSDVVLDDPNPPKFENLNQGEMFYYAAEKMGDGRYLTGPWLRVKDGAVSLADASTQLTNWPEEEIVRVSTVTITAP